MMAPLFRWHRSHFYVLLLCVALAALWDFLFWDHPLGISAAIFTGALSLALILRSPALRKTPQGRFLACTAALAVGALVEEPSSLAIMIVLLNMGTLVLISQRDLSLLHDSVSSWFARWMLLAVTLWLRIFRDNVLVARWLIRHPRLGGRLYRLLASIAWWVLPLVAGAIFAGLFALANPVIAQFFGQLQEMLGTCFDWLMNLAFTRIALWLVVITLVYGLMRHRHTWGTAMRVPPVVGQEPYAVWLTSPQMIIRLLLVLNAVFVIENILDAAYLYAGVPLPRGLSYTEYAHRGAYTLIATALLAGFFTLAAFRKNGTAHRSRACRRLVYAWILQNVLLLISTVCRVWHYVDVDKLTRLRLSTMIWCAIVAAGFLWIILRIMHSKTNAWLWRMNAFTALAVLFACAFINFDGIIADFNVRHCAQSGGRGARLDIDYLHHLGPHALPAVAWIRAQQIAMTAAERTQMDATFRDLRRQLDDELSNWRGWTYRRWREAPVEMKESAVARW